MLFPLSPNSFSRMYRELSSPRKDRSFPFPVCFPETIFLFAILSFPFVRFSFPQTSAVRGSHSSKHLRLALRFRSPLREFAASSRLATQISTNRRVRVKDYSPVTNVISIEKKGKSWKRFFNRNFRVKRILNLRWFETKGVKSAKKIPTNERNPSRVIHNIAMIKFY